MPLITGATGFLGQHLVTHIKRHATENIRVLLTKTNSDYFTHENRIEKVKGNLLNKKTLYEFLHHDAILINLAFLTNGSLKNNLTAIRNLAEVSIEKGIRRFIHLSTADVAGESKEVIITENTVCKPKTQYEITKWKIENELVNIIDNSCELVIIRPTAIFGAGGKNLLKLAYSLKTGPVFLRYLRSCLYNRRKMNLVTVNNVVHVIFELSMTKKNIHNQIFIISDDDEKMNNYRAVEKFLASLMGVPNYPIPIIPFPLRILSMILRLTGRSSINPSRVYSSRKLRNFGISKIEMLEDGLESFANWYLSEIHPLEMNKK